VKNVEEGMCKEAAVLCSEILSQHSREATEGRMQTLCKMARLTVGI